MECKIMKARFFVTTALALVVSAGFAHANTITGSVWEGVSANATPGNVPLTPADVTFSTNSPIAFDSRGACGCLADGTNYTIGSFMNTSTPATVFVGAAHLGDNLDNTIWDFRGTVSVTNGETFNVAHDDGLTLVIDGITVINAPGPTSPTTTTATYGGPTGNFAFELVYSEVMGPPAVLRIDLPFVGSSVQGQTPLPAALPLFASGLGLFGAASWRRRRKAARA
jgi:hypothetical protein